MRAGLPALLALALCACDEHAAEAARGDAGAGARGCYETHPVDGYCDLPGALCGLGIDAAVAALCARLADAGTDHPATIARASNSCGGTTLAYRAAGATQDYHFTGTGDFIGTTTFVDDARPDCPQGTSVTYGAPCDRFDEMAVACP